MRSRTAFRIVLCLTFAILAGCGTGLYKVKGRIVKNGEPAMPGKGLHYEVGLIPLDAAGNSLQDVYPANRGKERNDFAVPGKTGKGIPPGKYRIGIRMTDAFGERDELLGAFGDDKSPIIRDIQSSEELVIDLAKPSG